jgi:hypothetical protein
MKMKLIITLLMTISIAGHASFEASIQPTKEIGIKIENLSDLSFSTLKLTPRLRCVTTTTLGFGDFTSLVNDGDLESSYIFQNNESDLDLYFSIDNSVVVKAPEKKKVSDTRFCYIDANMYYGLKNEHPLPNPKELDYFTGNLGYIVFKERLLGKTSKDFTEEFENELSGEYQIKLIDGGTAWCSSLRKRCPVCSLGLFKETSAGLVKLGHGMSFRRENCIVKNN